MADPSAFHASGRFAKAVPVRLRPGTDVMEGLKQVCEAHGIRQGAILMGIGSLRQLSYQVLTPKPETKLGAGYTDPVVVPGPVEILSLQGVIFQISLDVDPEVRRRIRLAAAKRDVSIRQYVMDALRERLREDLGDDGESLLVLSAKGDPVLAALWDNDRDAAYDRL
jgi:predicted DNA-binding protein with PD1-like motif